MQENDFEKQIRETMEAYRLSPSASVWEKVKQRIKTRRRRVWPFILLPVVLITVGYFIFNNTVLHVNTTVYSDTALGNRKASSSVTQPNLVAGNKYSIKHKSTDSLNIRTHSTASQRIALRNNNTQLNGKYYSDKKINEHIQRKEVLAAQKEAIVITHDPLKQKNDAAGNAAVIKTNDTPFNSKTIKANDALVQKNSLPIIKSINTLPGKSAGSIVISTPLANKPAEVKDSASKSNISSSVINPTNTLQKQAINNPQKKTTAKKARNDSFKSFKWQRGITALYGRSNTTQNLFNLSADAEKVYNNPNNVTSGPFSRDSDSSTSKTFKYSDAFKAGITIQRRISKNGFITSGLNYVQLSNKANVVRGFDSVTSLPTTSFDLTYLPQSNTSFSVASKTFTSIYRFIELPVQWQQKVLQGKKLSLSYNAGFSVMKLLSSKALLYDENKNIYFFNKDALRSTQLQLNAGLNLHVPFSNKYSFSIGPQLNYSLSNTLNTKEYGKYHFMYYGLQANLLMHK